MKRILASIVTVAAFAVAAAPAGADVTLPAGVTQTGPTAFAAAPSFCPSVCSSAIDGYTFTGIPYSPFVRDVFLRLPATTPTAVDVWRAIRSEPGYRPGAPVRAVSGEATVSGEVDGTVDPNRSSWG